MNLRIISCLLFLVINATAYGQDHAISLKSNNKQLETSFAWAKQMALSYKGKPGDPVGPWYESALPPRSAFCMRDVAHQSIGGEILGLAAENRNMISLFVKNISESKDWCSYWEINGSGVPAPEDYRNDDEFWYNLNANFDILNACWRLFLWTGDKRYISDPEFLNFHKISVHEYIDRWILQVDSLLVRPSYPNVPIPFNIKDAFHRCRGLPSYSEGVHDLKVGIDLIASIYRGLQTYADILRVQGKTKQAEKYEAKAEQYRQHIEKFWWDDSASRYNTHMTNDGEFGKGEGETFLLWFDVLKDSVRTKNTIEHLTSKNWNVENLSYFPFLLYKFGYPQKAQRYIYHLSDPETKRREYPEVSFGVIEGIIQGMMGIDADARSGRVSTMYNGNAEDTVLISDLPVMSTLISVKHAHNSTKIRNQGEKTITWQPMFKGKHGALIINGKKVKASHIEDRLGNPVSFAEVKLKPDETAIAFIK